jgi:HK97 family phage prohead protease
MSELMRKQYVAKSIDIDDDERSLTAIISTDTVDRDGEVLLPKGAILDNFMKNPVVLWAHDYYDTPIARALWIKKGRGRITAKAKFADTDKAEEIYQLYKGGFLNAFSVGFDPREYREPKPEEIKKKPDWANARRIYETWELLEFSGVPVPANPEALALAVKTKELSLSKQTCGELGIDEEDVVYFADGPYVKTATAGPETEELIQVDPYIVTDAFIRTGPDPNSIMAEVAKKVRGRMF